MSIWCAYRLFHLLTTGMNVVHVVHVVVHIKMCLRVVPVIYGNIFLGYLYTCYTV